MPVVTLLAYIGVVWAAAAVGRALVDRLVPASSAHLPAGRPQTRNADLSQPSVADTAWIPLEKNLAAVALGLGCLSYGMLVLGLAHLFYRWAACFLIVAFIAVGVAANTHTLLFGELRAYLSRLRPRSFLTWLSCFLFVALAAIALVGVFTPPSLGLEWDSLSYHLADPKIYLQQHKIFYIPWESHSNFAFTAEMWYAFGLLTLGVPMAKLFHFGCAAGTAVALYAIGRRYVNGRVGGWSALIFASAPIVIWEAGTAYADLSTCFFATTALLVLSIGMQRQNTTANDNALTLAALLAGFMLSTKATSLGLLAIAVIALLYWNIGVLKRAPGMAAAAAGRWLVLALIVGSPWYVKSTVYTGNPVYPFFYKYLGGRDFSLADSAAYDQSNASFGVGRSPLNLLQAPWNVTMNPVPGHPLPTGLAHESFNDKQSLLSALPPVLLASLFFPAFIRRKDAPFVSALACGAAAATLFWFCTAQYVRYLLPVVPVFCLLSAWVIDRILKERWLSGYVLAGLAVCSIGFGVYVGLGLVSLELPVAFGAMPVANYLAAGDPAYPVFEYVNGSLPESSRIVLYGNPLGFYCDRPYLWGEEGHSTYIPYARFHSADDLRSFLAKVGVTDILINREYFPETPGYPTWVYQLAESSGPPLAVNGPVALFAMPK